MSGLLISIFGIFSRHMVFLSAGILILAIVSTLIIRMLNLHAKLKHANICIDGYRIEALNIANLEREANDTLTVQRAYHYYRIIDDNLEMCFEYSGICKKGSPVETGFIFSLDSDTYTPFDKLVLFGYDLKSDPDQKKKIQPILNSKDGLTKKIKLPFSRKLLPGDKFHVALFSELYGCLQRQDDYVFATLSFQKNNKIDEFYVFIEFVGENPFSLKVYDGTNGDPKQIKELSPYYQQNETTYFMDCYKDLKPKKALIYYFTRNR